ncbi:hypothetical protein BON22_1358 [Cyberlindnera fabianii]|nr:hypothetical protein BON22_1358 [Cyberlindnera fabianii]
MSSISLKQSTTHRTESKTLAHTRHSAAFKRCHDYIDQNKFDSMFKMLNNPSFSTQSFTTSELTEITQRLLDLGLHRSVLNLYHIFPSKFNTSPDLLQAALESAYKPKNFELFEEIFTQYIQQSEVSAHYFNMALSVFLRTDTEFAKQLLYQMVSSDYPKDENTVYIFLKVANRVSTFPTVKFALDLIKNNPTVPVSPKVYGLLVTGFLNGATAGDMSQLTKYLRSQGAEEHDEVKMAYFLHGLMKEDVDTALLQVETIAGQFDDSDITRRLLTAVYYQFHKKMTVNHISKYLSLLQRFSIEVTPQIHVQVILNLARGQMLSEIVHYIKLAKKQNNLVLNETYFLGLARSFIVASPDNNATITNKFIHTIRAYKSVIPWANDVIIELKKTQHATVIHTHRSPRFADREKKIKELINKQDDRGLLYFVNELLRAGIRPPIPMLNRVLDGLIQLESTHDTSFYRLIQDLHVNIPVDVDLSMLQKEVRHAVKTGVKSDMTSGMVRQFVLKNQDKFNTTHFNRLASLAIEIRNHGLAIELIAQARTSDSYRVDRNTITLYATALRALAHNGDPAMMRSMLDHVAQDDDLLISSAFMDSVKRSRKLLAKKVEKKELDRINGGILAVVDKWRKQKQDQKKTVHEMIMFLNEWIEEDLRK